MLVPYNNVDRDSVQRLDYSASIRRRLGLGRLQQVTDFFDDQTVESLSIPGIPKIKTPQQIEDCEKVIQETIDLIKVALGLCTQARRPSIDKIYLYDQKEFGKVSAAFDNVGDVGICQPSYHMIFLNEIFDKDLFLNSLRHELVHILSRSMVGLYGLVVNGDDMYCQSSKLIATGYSYDKKFTLLNEGITELINMEILQLNKSLSGKLGIRPAYYGIVAFVEILFEAASVIQEIPLDELKRKVYKGYFDGNPAALRPISKTLGSKSFREIGRLKINNDINSQLTAILLKAGLGQYVPQMTKKCYDFYQGDLSGVNYVL